MVVFTRRGEIQPGFSVPSLRSITARDSAAVGDHVAGEDEEDAPHAGQEGGGEEREEDQPVPESEVTHLGQEAVIVRPLLASIRVTHHSCSVLARQTDSEREIRTNNVNTKHCQLTEVSPLLTSCVIRKAGWVLRSLSYKMYKLLSTFTCPDFQSFLE